LRFSKTVAALLWATATLNPLTGWAEGMVLVPSSDGSFQFRQQSSSFARHYGAHGSPIIPEAERQASLPKDALTLLERPGGDVSVPRRVVGRPEVIDAIERLLVLTVTQPALRKSGLTVNEWRFFFRANIEVESAYRQEAISTAGAIGLGQLMPETAEELGVDPNDPLENLDGSARYLALMLREFGNPQLALAAYNAGPAAVHRYGGIPPYPETQNHVARVLAVVARLEGSDS